MDDFDRRARAWDNEPRRWALAAAVADGIRAAVPLHQGMIALDYAAAPVCSGSPSMAIWGG